jgi:hypothetical protein
MADPAARTAAAEVGLPIVEAAERQVERLTLGRRAGQRFEVGAAPVQCDADEVVADVGARVAVSVGHGFDLPVPPAPPIGAG